MDAHSTAVAAIAANVRYFYDRKKPFRIYHGSTNSTRQSQYRRDQMVDTSAMSHVVKIDTEQKTALVEPNVPMDALVEATLQHGLIPPVVIEFPGVTVGGGFAGTSGESSSFRHGFFDRTINWIELVLANGEIVTASSTENPDLFYGAASSFGTLGVTTLLELRLKEAKSYVELTYYPVFSMSEAIEKIQQATADSSNDYLDGIMYSQNSGVVCSGRLTNDVKKEVRVQRFTRPADRWFYLHAQKLIKGTRSPITEAVPIVDYVFRYDRGGFWVAAYAFKYFVTPFNRITRWMLDRFMHTRVMYHALHKSGFSSQYVVQDVGIPYSKSDEFFQYLDHSFKHYPIWLCPLKCNVKSIDPALEIMYRKTTLPLPEMLLNFGIWGPGPKDRRKFVEWNRNLERKVHELEGQKWLYAHTYYTEEEFNQIYDRETYDALRRKYHATYLPSVYDKVNIDITAEERALKESWTLWLLALFWSIWPLSGLYGVYKAAFGGDYLLPRKTNKALESQ
ncbi:hypothetical protein UA08_06016 [Talaromyces atroroseus]|uniref:Delta(24)-sterol reductase n=1 Tax=Talaromyces atroroseus TaxID=1441469 RepID=A0A225AU70_TALAT|nr:hypothetical protein UA08_06016 [Talaromyces atroroseus]OKL58486.1 hypothetical protein UA08_06016 [Talaromyces atroroseus]